MLVAATFCQNFWLRLLKIAAFCKRKTAKNVLDQMDCKISVNEICNLHSSFPAALVHSHSVRPVSSEVKVVFALRLRKDLSPDP